MIKINYLKLSNLTEISKILQQFEFLKNFSQDSKFLNTKYTESLLLKTIWRKAAKHKF
jgi:hypothetical protein